MLTNPFYYGLMEYGGETVMGRHRSLISKATFDRVQEILNKKYDKRPRIHNFPFTGLIRCSECSGYITAEKHFKNYPKTRGIVEYSYYRCTKKRKNCSQPFISAQNLEEQLRDIVGTLSLKVPTKKFLILPHTRKRKKS